MGTHVGDAWTRDTDGRVACTVHAVALDTTKQARTVGQTCIFSLIHSLPRVWMPWMPQPHEHSIEEVEGRLREELEEEEGRWTDEDGVEEDTTTRLRVIGTFGDITRPFRQPPDIHMRLRARLSILKVLWS